MVRPRSSTIPAAVKAGLLSVYLIMKGPIMNAGSNVKVVDVHAGRRTDGGPAATAAPPLSWVVETDCRDWMQAAVDVEKDGVVRHLEGDASVFVDWPFAPLAPRERCSIRVRVTGEDGTTSEWSAPITVFAGHLPDGDWTAQFVGLRAPTIEAQPVLLRRDFTVDDSVRSAVLYATARGVYQAEINGHAVDDAEMKPGWTAYQFRLLYDVTDVTSLLHQGPNTVGVDLAGGWYTERYGFGGNAGAFYGEQPAFAGQLVIEYESGRIQVVASDQTWFATSAGPRRASGIYQGEVFDARRTIPGWSSPAAPGSWELVAVREGAAAPSPRATEPVRVTQELAVESAFQTPAGKTVVDFGQNVVGRLRVRLSGAPGTTVTLRHAEVLENGELGIRPLRRAAATDTYTLRGDGAEVWEPRFTFHGFRYAQIDGWPGTFDPSAVTAVVVHSDMRRTGWFESSHDLLNRLHENVVWGMRGNFLSVPTDCPQRDERLGWTGDIQVFAPTAGYLFDCDAFLASWLEDLRADQAALGGVVPFVVPNVLPGPAIAAAAWGDAATVVPTVLLERFNDLDVVRQQYASMKTWADTIEQLAGSDLLWEGHFQFGDWLDPDSPPEDPARAKADQGIVATAYLYRSTRLVAAAARKLDERSDADTYEERAERIRAAFNTAYVTPLGRMLSDAPTAYALALRFGLVPEHLRQGMGDRLAFLVRAAGYHVGTGFVGTPLILDALADTGHVAVAGRLLQQSENPSWLYAVTMGATTIWERWDSMLEDGTINPGEMTSFNHYAFGAVADWMHRSLGGLAPAAPGYKRMIIAPNPVDGVDWVRTSHLTPYGEAKAGWTRHDGSFDLDVTIPANVTADVHMPDGVRHQVGSGTYRFTASVATGATPRRAVSLDSSLVDIIDDKDAYERLIVAISRSDPAGTGWLRRRTKWVPERTLRSALLMAPAAAVAEVEAELEELTRVRNGA
jgi:alpha-L-rhamnosidase